MRSEARDKLVTEAFLAELRETANVSHAARSAGIPRRTVYEWRAADPEFAADWDDALDEAVDGLEAEAWRRARDGIDEPVFYKGERVATITRYSDTLMTFLLKAHRYRDRVEVTGKGGGPLEVLGIEVVAPESSE